MRDSKRKQIKMKFKKKNFCEICKKPILTDKHHIQSKSIYGTNYLYNLCELCPNCHRLVHDGEIILEGRFLTSDCKLNQTELIWRYKNNESITNVQDPKVYKIERSE
jgi:hypothetical protein